MTKSKKQRIRHIIETVISALLPVFQYIPVVGPWHGLMLLPLITYILSLLWSHPEFLGEEVYVLLFSDRLILGRAIAFVGFITFLTAYAQFLRRRGKLVTTGLYSFVRHPQYLGITVTTLGISIMCVQYAGKRLEVLGVWMIQVLGYVLLAYYEEQRLAKEHRGDYKKYKQNIPFLFPVPPLTRIPEPLLSIALSLIIVFLCTFL